MLALIAVAAAAPQFYAAAPAQQYYAAASPVYQNYYNSPYAQPLLAKYIPSPQAPANTEHATHVAAATPLVYSYYPSYAYAAAPAVSAWVSISSQAPSLWTYIIYFSLRFAEK